MIRARVEGLNGHACEDDSLSASAKKPLEYMSTKTYHYLVTLTYGGLRPPAKTLPVASHQGV